MAWADRKVAQGIHARSARDIPVAGRFALLPMPLAFQTRVRLRLCFKQFCCGGFALLLTSLAFQARDDCDFVLNSFVAGALLFCSRHWLFRHGAIATLFKTAFRGRFALLLMLPAFHFLASPLTG
ncbi:hypothetical protein N5580_03035 [Pantoea piersonii]|uniref:Uncharacterized protein n=1 Tax=Pantoea piersonii TaxID=2364647 RepID=A0AAJ5U9Z3_9GAMM|nr:hypothetical protein [Pantoea piersonii]WBG91551.1 hypothetical protein N5580_03035 [Pantoea piersonii]